MNNIVKIILGVNIAAAGAGIFFGLSKSGKIGDLVTAKETAETAVQRANQSSRDADKNAKDAAKKEMAVKDGEIIRLGTELQTAKQRPSQQDLDAAVLKSKADSSSQLQTLQAERVALQGAANQVPALEGKLAEYAIHGTPVEIKALLDELATMKQGTAPAPKKPKIKPLTSGEIAVINNYDQKYGFYTLNRGSNIGIKVGDKFSIFRNDNIVGKVVVKRVNPTLSIASFDPALPKPTVPFKVGDKVMKLN